MTSLIRLPVWLVRPCAYWFHGVIWRLSKLPQRLKIVGLALALLSLSLCGHPWQSTGFSDAATVIRTPLSTRGAQIVDAAGRPVLLRGVNWFGLETEFQVPHGLWARDYKEMLSQIKSLGYNVIRLPYSVQALRSSEISRVDFNLGSNRELESKTPLEVMDLIVQEAGRQGLLILLDSHRLNNQSIPELWYGDGFTEADWIDTWKMLANRYKDQPNIIGADLKNEPHGRASWGTNDPATDWRLAAERAGNAILAINPNWLILVEGVENNVPGQKLVHWQGGNLEGVKRYPVRLSVPRKLVYSPHEYGPGVYNHAWFSDSAFPRNLLSRWETGFHYIASQNIAPIWIGEFGGRQVDDSSKEGVWQQQLVDYIAQKKLSFTYWTWNPDSVDTGGILLDDWRNINVPKQRLLSKLLPSGARLGSVSRPSPVASAAPPRPPTPAPAASSSRANLNLASNVATGSNLKAELRLQSDWETGFCTNLQVTNQGRNSTRNWQLTFAMNQAAINNTWNGNFQPQGSRYLVTPLAWGQAVEPSQTLELGFCANKLGSDYRPRLISVNGS
ncbi:cellulase family glycosylhydrolase [Leptolyngbya sp. FACHB-261]|uniref:cellulase family glycosylhydrolase n=1 Tax=Leptolyngbya sp. FACHB-261 TaxID=2692806 RepID=UPI0016854B3E|nr:cellulase family glycosylhydrolase [Leptolyngbya sp. FACHB-261]MBD2101695.1 cellulase family glycosylhydrolase [Leptolyngbya sp. FACHB-261]